MAGAEEPLQRGEGAARLAAPGHARNIEEHAAQETAADAPVHQRVGEVLLEDGGERLGEPHRVGGGADRVFAVVEGCARREDRPAAGGDEGEPEVEVFADGERGVETQAAGERFGADDDGTGEHEVVAEQRGGNLRDGQRGGDDVAPDAAPLAIDVVGAADEPVGIGAGEKLEGVGEMVGLPGVVGVEEGDVGAAGEGEQGVAGARDAEVGRAAHELDAVGGAGGERGDDGGRVVVSAVLEDEHFPLRPGLGGDGVEGRTEVGGSPVGRDDDGDKRVGRRGGHQEVISKERMRW